MLLGDRRGDNNQLLALAEALGRPFETRSLEYNKHWHTLLRLFPAQPYLLTRNARRTLAPPWPDLVIGIGRRSVPVARWLRKMNGGLTKIVRLGNPRTDPRLFDLVITTAQYPVKQADNVLTLPLAMGRHAAPPDLTDHEANWLASLPRPHLLLSLGGTTRYWRLPESQLVDAAERLAERAATAGGSLIVVTSPRTSDDTVQVVEDVLKDHANCRIVADGGLRYAVLLNDADEQYVTSDSVSMISEAVLTGKPVGLIPVELDEEGERALGTDGYSASTRDIRRFWAALQAKALIGSIDEPACGPAEDPVKIAASAVRRLLGDRVE